MKFRLKSILLLFLVVFMVLGVGINGYGKNEQESREVDYLNKEIRDRKDKIDKIKQQREEYENRIEKIQKEQASLKNQLAIIDNRLAKTELDIEDTKAKISKVNLEIKRVNFEIRSKQKEIKKEKEHIGEILNLMYKQSQADTLEVLLMNDSLSDFLNKIRYLEDVNKEMEVSVEELKNYKKDLEEDKDSLGEKSDELAGLRKELEKKRNELKKEQESKKYILGKTEASEDRYQSLLAQAKKERQQISREISSLEKKVRQKLEKTSEDKLEYNEDGLIWPVPSHYITVSFHDPDYPFRYLFEHPAIDLRAAQGTPIKSAASGYVARVKYNPNSSNYAYIMVVHGDGLATVYGHISKPLVSEEEYVTQGQVIAKSGGMPGTAGAGRLTTGPHLHFEVRLNGIPTDPLDYLQ